jgi:hypothetical protein
MDVGVNTKHPLARAILALLFLFGAPAGFWVLRGAFGRQEPHILVMLVFSGSLILLLGLTGLIGFLASFASGEASADKSPADASSAEYFHKNQESAGEKSSAPNRGHP